MSELTELQVKQLNDVAACKNKNERLSWKRKYEKLQEIITNEIRPLEDSILTILEKKMHAIDRMEELRQQMSKECVHPKSNLVHKGDYIECKFCDTKLSIPR